jgi:hypothetical protein
MSNWLGSDQNRAVLASVALAHGIPHKGDKLLYKHYSNRPWAHLFEAQKEYRQLLQPMFDEVPDPLSVHDPLTSQIVDLWNSGNQDLRAIAKACDVHIATVRRKLRDCDLCRRRPENVAPGGEWRSDEKRSAQMITCSGHFRFSENPKSFELACYWGQVCTPIWSSGLRFAVAF